MTATAPLRHHLLHTIPVNLHAHTCILQKKAADHPVHFLYSDGEPDHRLTFASVNLSLITLFRVLDLDYMCTA